VAKKEGAVKYRGTKPLGPTGHGAGFLPEDYWGRPKAYAGRLSPSQKSRVISQVGRTNPNLVQLPKYFNKIYGFLPSEGHKGGYK